MALPIFLTVEQVAEVLHVSRSTVCTLIRSGQIPATRVGRRWLVPERALVELEQAAAGERRAS